MSMYECPNCKHTSDTFTVSGVLVTGQVSVKIGANGTIEAVGPVRPTAVVKPGQELACLRKVMLSCPYCDFTGKPSEFTFIVESVLSGRRATAKINVPQIGDVYLCDDEIELARRVFSPANLQVRADDNEAVSILEL